jgi:hypothetical protein
LFYGAEADRPAFGPVVPMENSLYSTCLKMREWRVAPSLITEYEAIVQEDLL